MKAVAEEMRLSPLGRQQCLARLADDIQRYWAALRGPECILPKAWLMELNGLQNISFLGMSLYD